MSERGIFGLKPDLRLERRSQGGQDETQKPDHSASLGDSITSSTRIRFSVNTTVCKILGQEEVKPHKVRYYLERRDAEFEQKMAEVLCVYREVQILKKAAAKAKKKAKKP